MSSRLASASSIASVLRTFERDPRLSPHSERSPDGTSYISIFVTTSGDAIAVDKKSGRPAIWILKRRMRTQDLPMIEREFYPADKGRNSNLNVSELKGMPLWRLYPRDSQEARQIVDHLVSQA